MSQIRLGDALELLVDNRGKNPPFVASGVPIVTAMSVKDGVLDLRESRFVSEQTWSEWMPVPLRKDDVLLTSEAPLGRVALVRSSDPILPTQRIFALRGRRGILDSRYLYYSIQTLQFQAQLQGRATGTTVVGIRQPALRSVELHLPTYEVQRAIAEVLGALDDKIAANNSISDGIDELTSAFLAQELRAATRWTSLGSIADINMSTVNPRRTGQLRYIDIASVRVGSFDFPELTDWDSAPSRARRGVQRGDTIWSTVRPNRRSHALVLSTDPALVASTGLAVLTPKRGNFAFLYEVTRLPEFTSFLEAAADGSAYPAVRAERFADAPIPSLPLDAQTDFERVAAPMRQHAHALQEESRTLAELRDTLLPPLMSGRLRVKDAEKQVEAVV